MNKPRKALSRPKERTNPIAPPTEPDRGDTPPGAPKRAPAGSSDTLVGARVPRALKRQLKIAAATGDESERAIVERALTNELRRLGFWPPRD